MPFSPRVLPFRFPAIDNIRCLFTSSFAGNFSSSSSDLLSNEKRIGQRAELLNKMMLEFNLDGLAEIYQVHGDDFVKAENTINSQKKSIHADGHYTDKKNLALIIETADCQPILLAHKQAKAVAAIHVGWRANVFNFPGTAVQRFCETYSCSPDELVAVRGPSLGPASAEFINFKKEWPESFYPWFNEESRTMDLWALSRYQLEKAGLRPSDIFSLDFCTRTMSDLFYSHRRGQKGRQISLIWME